MKKVFLDTNVIVYANDPRDPEKQSRAAQCIARAMRDGTGVVSTQVFQEFAAVAGAKLHQDRDAILAQLVLLEVLEVVFVTPAIIRRALELQWRYGIAYWDASILAAAEQAHCAVLLSEDFSAGQLYVNVRVENPLAAARE